MVAFRSRALALAVAAGVDVWALPPRLIRELEMNSAHDSQNPAHRGLDGGCEASALGDRGYATLGHGWIARPATP